MKDYKLTETIKQLRSEIEEQRRTMAKLNAKIKKRDALIIKINGDTMRLLNND